MQKRFNFDEERENLENQIKKFKNNISKQISTIKETCINYMGKYDDVLQINGMIRHEVIPVINLLSTHLKMLKQNSNDTKIILESEELIQITERILQGLYLFGLSKEDIQERSVQINLERMVMENIEGYSKKLNDKKLKISFKYNQMNNQPISIYSDISIFQMVIGSSITNCMNYAPEKTKINVGMGVFDDNLEVILKNKTDENKRQNNFGGMGLRLGLPFVRKIVREFNGEIIQDSKNKFEDKYHNILEYGFQENLPPNEYKNFIFKFRIPMKELTKSLIEKA